MRLFPLFFIVLCVFGYDEEFQDRDPPNFDINVEDIFNRLVEAGIDPNSIHIPTTIIPLDSSSEIDTPKTIHNSNDVDDVVDGDDNEVYVSVDDLMKSQTVLVDVNSIPEANMESDEEWLRNTVSTMMGSADVSSLLNVAPSMDAKAKQPIETINDGSLSNSHSSSKEKYDISSQKPIQNAVTPVEISIPLDLSLHQEHSANPEDPRTRSQTLFVQENHPSSDVIAQDDESVHVIKGSSRISQSLPNVGEVANASVYAACPLPETASHCIPPVCPELSCHCDEGNSNDSKVDVSKLLDVIGALEVERDNLKQALAAALDDLEIASRNISMLETKARLARNEKNLAQLTVENCRLHGELSQQEHAERIQELTVQIGTCRTMSSEQHQSLSASNAKPQKSNSKVSSAESASSPNKKDNSPGQPTGSSHRTKPEEQHTFGSATTQSNTNNNDPAEMGSPLPSYSGALSVVPRYLYSLCASVGRKSFEFVRIRYESEEYDNSYLVWIVDSCIEGYFHVEGFIHTIVYNILTYYDSEDLWIRVYLGLKDLVLVCLNGLLVASDGVGDLITSLHLLSPEATTIVSKLIVFAVAATPIIIFRKFVLGIGAVVLMIILSPVFIVVFVFTTIGQYFQKKQPKEPKKRKPKKLPESNDPESSDTAPATAAYASSGSNQPPPQQYQQYQLPQQPGPPTTNAFSTSTPTQPQQQQQQQHGYYHIEDTSNLSQLPRQPRV